MWTKLNKSVVIMVILEEIKNIMKNNLRHILV